MSKPGKILFLFSFLFILALYGGRLVLGGWRNEMWAPLGLGLAFFIVAVIKEARPLREFLTMRTTKHGMNMGLLIVITLVGLACVNYLAAKYEKNFDWTSEHLNSLSDQSIKAVQSLKEDTEIVLLYRQDKQEENVQRAVRAIADMYQNVSKKVKYTAYNALQRPDLTSKYDFASGSYAVYVEQGDKKLKVDPPNEESFTRAFIKLGRDKKKVLYFTMGHGEAVLDDKADAGLSGLKDELSVTYDVKPLILFQSSNKVPDDADTVAIVRPQQQYLEVELQALRDYARRGGHLLIAIDPGMHHNLAQLTKTLGVEFENNFILDLRSRVVKGGPAMVLGTEFNRDSEITKAFGSNGQYAIFYLASELRKAPDAAAGVVVDPLVKTDKQSMIIPEIKERIEFHPNGPHILAMTAKGKLPGSIAPTDKGGAAQEFSAVVFGDSDFMLNNFLHNNLNRDLVMNSVAWLASDKDLISIRPKEPKSSKLTMTNQDFMLFLIGFLVPLPVLMFLCGGLVWWKRRTA